MVTRSCDFLEFFSHLGRPICIGQFQWASNEQACFNVEQTLCVSRVRLSEWLRMLHNGHIKEESLHDKGVCSICSTN